MTELSHEDVAALRELLPEINYGKILKRMAELKANPLHKNNYELVAVQEHQRDREVELVNLALRCYGTRD